MKQQESKSIFRYINSLLFSSSAIGSLEAFVFYISIGMLITGVILFLLSVADSFSNNPFLNLGISGLLLNTSMTCVGAFITWKDDFPIGTALMNLLEWTWHLLLSIPLVAAIIVLFLGLGALVGCLFFLLKGIHNLSGFL